MYSRFICAALPSMLSDQTTGDVKSKTNFQKKESEIQTEIFHNVIICLILISNNSDHHNDKYRNWKSSVFKLPWLLTSFWVQPGFYFNAEFNVKVSPSESLVVKVTCWDIELGVSHSAFCFHININKHRRNIYLPK